MNFACYFPDAAFISAEPCDDEGRECLNGILDVVCSKEQSRQQFRPCLHPSPVGHLCVQPRPDLRGFKRESCFARQRASAVGKWAIFTHQFAKKR